MSGQSPSPRLTDNDRTNIAFLMGIPRSGTTLLSALLCQHSAIHVPPEPWLMLALAAFGQVPPRHTAAAHLIGEAVNQFLRDADFWGAAVAFARHLYEECGRKARARYLIDKTPRYYQVVPFIRQCFPNEPFVVLLRNPLSVVASMKLTFGFDILCHQSVPFFYFDIALGNRILADLIVQGEHTYCVRYEDLVVRPSVTLPDLELFLNLPHELDGTLDPLGARERYDASAMGDKNLLQTEAVHTQSLDRWKEVLTRDEMQAAYDLLGSELLHRLGYGEVVRELSALGVRTRSEKAVDLLLRPLREEYRRRQEDCWRSTRDHAGIKSLLTALDSCYAAPEHILALEQRHAEALSRVCEERDLARQELARLQARQKGTE